MEKVLSIQLDLARFVFSALVLFHHLEHITSDRRISFLASFGHDSVIFFFLLSGFVISYVAQHREPTLGAFAIARVARLYSVCLPALILSFLLTLLGLQVQPDRYIEYANTEWIKVFLSGLLFLNQTSLATVDIPTNAPYWSIGYEAWYYVIFALAFYLRGWQRIALVTLAVLIAGLKIIALFPIWLLGVVCYRYCGRVAERPLAGVVIASVGFLTYAFIRLNNLDDALFRISAQLIGGESAANQILSWSKRLVPDLIISFLFVIVFYGVYSARALYSDILLRYERGIRAASKYTFSLYLFHYPLLYFFYGVYQSTIFVLTISVLFVVALGGLAESQKSRLAGWMGQRS